MPKDDEVFGLFKVPDAEVIKGLRLEIGILKSEKDELQYELDDLKQDRKPHKHSENSEFIKSLEGQVRNLKQKLANYEEGDLVVELKAKIESLEDNLSKDRKLVGILQAQLLKYAKKTLYEEVSSD